MGRIEQSAFGENWPLCDQSSHFELGHVLNSAIVEAIEPAHIGFLFPQHAGLWECDLANSALIWSGGVYDIFGLERRLPVTREAVLAHYTDESRARLERLRSHAIDQRLGFTIDVEIRAAAVGDIRRVRLIAAPVCIDNVAVRLHGLKLVV